VSAVGDAPFVRAGLDIVPLVADAHYQLVFAPDHDGLRVQVVDASGQVILRAHAAAEVPVADIILPATFWRASIVSDLR
jgi:hypothetical protein